MRNLLMVILARYAIVADHSLLDPGICGVDGDRTRLWDFSRK